MSQRAFDDDDRQADDDPATCAAGDSPVAAQPPLSTSAGRGPIPAAIAEAARFPEENPNPVFRIAADGRLLYANRASCLLLAAWQVAGDDYLPPPWRERIAAVLAAGEARKWDATCDDRILQLHCVPIPDAGYVNVYASDVTEREWLLAQLRARSQELESLNADVRALNAELEQRVQERTAELEAIFASLPDAVYVGDENGISRCNDAALDLLGCTSLGDLQDRIAVLSAKLHNRYADTGERIRPEDEVFARALHGETGTVELISRNLQTGQDVIVRSAARPILLRNQVIGAVAINTDITARKRAEQALRDSRAQLQVLARRLIEAQETERRALARELHDETGQIVTALSLGLNALAKHDEISPAVAARLARYVQMTSTLMGELHRVIENLRPSSLEQGGLVPAIARHAETLRDEYGLAVQLAVAGVDAPRLPYDIEVAFYRLIQEAMTNIVRHAQAANVSIEVEQRTDMLTAVVRDDGRGFDLPEAVRRGRLGLLGMRERAEMWGGRLVIESAPGNGTTVRVEIPLLANPGR